MENKSWIYFSIAILFEFGEFSSGHPEAWVITAITTLRHHFGNAIKIIFYSRWLELREEALAAGADAWCSRAASGQELRQMIRSVMGQGPAPEAPSSLEA